MKSAVSFIIPAYNAEDTLKESVDSILNGNIEDGDEIIIVNDCSTDKTQSIAEQLSRKYGMLKVVNNPKNIGCPASRNVGIREAKNDLIFNLDSDNILPPNSISDLKGSLIKNNADIVAFEETHYFKDAPDRVTHKWVSKNGFFTLSDLFSGTINPASGGNFLYKRSAWQNVHGYWEYGKGLHEAWGFSFKLLANSAVFFVVPKTYYWHRYSHESLFVRESKVDNQSVKMSNLFIQDFLEMFDDSSLNIIKNNPDWFNNLNRKPLVLRDGGVGTNGRVIFTSKIEQALHIFNQNVLSFIDSVF